MARQQNTFAAIRKAWATPVNAQEWTRAWILGNYFAEYHMSTKVSRTVAQTRADFDELYAEPAIERWAREPAPAPELEVTSDSSESGGVTLPATELEERAMRPESGRSDTGPWLSLTLEPALRPGRQIAPPAAASQTSPMASALRGNTGAYRSCCLSSQSLMRLAVGTKRTHPTTTRVLRCRQQLGRIPHRLSIPLM